MVPAPADQRSYSHRDPTSTRESRDDASAADVGGRARGAVGALRFDKITPFFAQNESTACWSTDFTGTNHILAPVQASIPAMQGGLLAMKARRLFLRSVQHNTTFPGLFMPTILNDVLATLMPNVVIFMTTPPIFKCAFVDYTLRCRPGRGGKGKLARNRTVVGTLACYLPTSMR